MGSCRASPSHILLRQVHCRISRVSERALACCWLDLRVGLQSQRLLHIIRCVDVVVEGG
jgi:hypothetical protein